MKIDILKCHGTGNDFVLIDEIQNEYGFTEEMRRKFAISVCNRDGNIGADGILFVQNSNIADGRMRIFNSDGSEAEMCGNGLRCVGRYVCELKNKKNITIQTMKAIYAVKSVEDIYVGVKTMEINIDTVDFNVNSLPMNYVENQLMFKKIKELSDTLTFTAVCITNPHIVSIVDKIDTEELISIGKKANFEVKEIFPKGVNVNFVKIINNDSIYVRTFERGVGLTKSCGTGMTASSVVTTLKDSKKSNKVINVYNDGGMIKCIVVKDKNDKYNVRFIGNASYIFSGNIDYDFNLNNSDFKFIPKYYNDETEQYSKFIKDKA